jgi:hypothetical protein
LQKIRIFLSQEDGWMKHFNKRKHEKGGKTVFTVFEVQRKKERKKERKKIAHL